MKVLTRRDDRLRRFAPSPNRVFQSLRIKADRSVERLTITCVSCGHGWTVPHTFSIYEQQAVESRPCPDCGAYTLCCRPADGGRWTVDGGKTTAMTTRRR